MAVKRVNSAEFQTEYSRVRNWLLEALEMQLDGGDEAKLLNRLGSEQYQLWTGEKSACVTEVCTIDDVKVCLLMLIAGEHNKALDEVLGGQTVVEEWAKEQGCKGFYGIGRPEWKRVVAPHGFKAVSVNFYKEFDR